MSEEIKKGLVGVVADSTAASKVNPDTNSLLYRGYPVQELAEKKSIEEVALFLWNGELASQAELDAFIKLERANRTLDPAVKAAIDMLPTDTHPMDIASTAHGATGARHTVIENSDPSVALGCSTLSTPSTLQHSPPGSSRRRNLTCTRPLPAPSVLSKGRCTVGRTRPLCIPSTRLALTKTNPAKTPLPAPNPGWKQPWPIRRRSWALATVSIRTATHVYRQ